MKPMQSMVLTRSTFPKKKRRFWRAGFCPATQSFFKAINRALDWLEKSEPYKKSHFLDM